MMSLEISVGQCDPSALELYGLSQLLVTTWSNSSGKKENMMLQAIKMNLTMPLCLMYQPVVAVREGGGDLQHDEETHDEE